MRGQRTLFDEMFGAQVEEKLAEEKQRPRNVLMPDRNLLLLYRYYFLVEISRMRFDDTLNQLEKEFFIVGMRIVTIMTDHDQQLRQIVQEKPSVTALEKMYPHINWKYNPIA